MLLKPQRSGSAIPKKSKVSSKLSNFCKQVLLILSDNSSSLQHDLSIVGLSISRLKLTIRELSNPRGSVYVTKTKDELYFPVHMLEWRAKMLDLTRRQARNGDGVLWCMVTRISY